MLLRECSVVKGTVLCSNTCSECGECSECSVDSVVYESGQPLRMYVSYLPLRMKAPTRAAPRVKKRDAAASVLRIAPTRGLRIEPNNHSTTLNQMPPTARYLYSLRASLVVHYACPSIYLVSGTPGSPLDNTLRRP